MFHYKDHIIKTQQKQIVVLQLVFTW